MSDFSENREKPHLNHKLFSYVLCPFVLVSSISALVVLHHMTAGAEERHRQTILSANKLQAQKHQLGIETPFAVPNEISTVLKRNSTQTTTVSKLAYKTRYRPNPHTLAIIPNL